MVRAWYDKDVSCNGVSCPLTLVGQTGHSDVCVPHVGVRYSWSDDGEPG